MAVLARIIAISIALAASGAAASPVIIANPSCPASRLTADQARRLLLGEDLSWDNGDATQLIEAKGETPAMAAGYPAIAHKTISQVRAEWNRLVFSGRANPPLRVGTDAEVRAEVARVPGSFAVVDSSVADATVKVIFRAGGD